MCRYAFFEAGKQKHKNAQNRCFTQFSQNFKSIELPHKMFETSPNFNTDLFLYKGNFLGGETMTIQNFENKHHPSDKILDRDKRSLQHIIIRFNKASIITLLLICSLQPLPVLPLGQIGGYLGCKSKWGPKITKMGCKTDHRGGH